MTFVDVSKLNPTVDLTVKRRTTGMRDNWALRKCSQGNHKAALADEMRAIIKEAAGNGEPGDGVKATLLRAHRNLGRPKYWRVRAAWNGEAGDWSAWVVEDFRERLNDLRDARARREAAQASAMGARLSAMRERLARTDAEFFGPEIAALEWALSWDRDADQPGAAGTGESRNVESRGED